MEHENLNLPKVINKIKTIAEKEYGGKIYENLLSIFYQLEREERKLFLQALYNAFTLIKLHPINTPLSCDITDCNKTCDHTNSLSENLKNEVAKLEDDDFNRQELVKLKTWLTKALAVILLVGFSVTMGLTVGFGDLAIKILSLIEGLFKVVKVLFTM